MTLIRTASPLSLLALFFALGCSSSSGTSSPVTPGGAGDGSSAGQAGAAAGGVAGSSASGGVTGGMGGTGAVSATGGGVAGAIAAGGTSGAAGANAAAGASGSAGMAGTGGAAGASGAAGNCGATTHALHPFGCKFAWGIASPNGALASYSYLQFMSSWIGSEVKADGSITSCSGCTWLTGTLASTNLIPAFYAYFIGFYGHANGIVDGNQTGTKKLTTDGAALIKGNRSKIIAMYAWYAGQLHMAWPSKPAVWLLEGDFVQYAATSQSSPLTYAELGQLAADITCAIKANMPNAVVAIDHSSWNADAVTTSYWNAMAVANYDMVWTTGVGNNNGYIEGSANNTTYNHATATYSYLHTLTGRTLLVDTSAGASAAGDSWSTASASDINGRITDGVIAANITGTAPTGLQGNISGLANVNAIASCP